LIQNDPSQTQAIRDAPEMSDNRMTHDLTITHRLFAHALIVATSASMLPRRLGGRFLPIFD
jgi:hypothetical protein